MGGIGLIGTYAKTAARAKVPYIARCTFVSRYQQFESISLQRRVRCELNLGKGGLPMRWPPGLLGARHPRAAVVAIKDNRCNGTSCQGVAPSGQDVLPAADRSAVTATGENSVGRPGRDEF